MDAQLWWKVGNREEMGGSREQLRTSLSRASQSFCGELLTAGPAGQLFVSGFWLMSMFCGMLALAWVSQWTISGQVVSGSVSLGNMVGEWRNEPGKRQ